MGVVFVGCFGFRMLQERRKKQNDKTINFNLTVFALRLFESQASSSVAVEPDSSFNLYLLLITVYTDKLLIARCVGGPTM